MDFLKNRTTAIIISGLIIAVSILYGLSKRPIDNDSVNSPILEPTISIDQPKTEPAQKSPIDEAYELGQTYYNNRDFKKAIAILEEVVAAEPSREEAQTLLSAAYEGYRAEILEIADGYALQQNYTTAIGIVNESFSVLPQDTELTIAIDKYKSMIRTAAIEAAGLCIAENDYAGALSAIQGAIDDTGPNEETTSLYTKYISDYKSFLTSEANRVYHSSGYEDAVNILRQGLRILGNDEEISNLLSEYQACAPVSYYSLLHSGYYYDGDDRSKYNLSDSIYDTAKNLHNNVLWSIENEHLGWVTRTRFYVDREFKRLSGTLFYRLDCIEEPWYKACVRIYGDGSLLYEESISNEDNSVNFEVDISDIIYLEVEIHTGTYGMHNTVYGGISDFNLFRNVME